MTGDALRLVVVDDRGLRWAVLADDVRAIVDAATWHGGLPLDVAARWAAHLQGASSAPRDLPPASRALVVRTAQGDQAFRAPQVSFEVAERSTLLSLPDLLASGRGAAMVAGIVFGDSGEPLVVLRPDGFLDEHEPTPTGAAANTSVTPALGETG
jgi:hypothetical protein